MKFRRDTCFLGISFLVGLLLASDRIQTCSSWTLQPLWPTTNRPHINGKNNRVKSTLLFAQQQLSENEGDTACEDDSSAQCQIASKQQLFSRAFGQRIASVSLTAALLFTNQLAYASDETAASPDASKADSVNVVVPSKNKEGPSPPEIKSKSSAKAMAISKKMKSLHARMYGAYWCGHCADQKETLGKEAFEKNVEYVECSEVGKNSQANGLCAEKDIRGYPTWEINGIKYSGERSLDELEKLVQMAQASSPSHPRAPPMISASSSERSKKLADQLAAAKSNLYGAYWCTHTFDQKELLGKEAFGKIPYIECAKDGENSQMATCKDKKIRVVPTWEINGELFEGERTMDDLERILQKIKPATVEEMTATFEQGGFSNKQEEPKEEKSASPDEKKTVDTSAAETNNKPKEESASTASSKEESAEDSSTLAATPEETAAKESSKKDEPAPPVAPAPPAEVPEKTKSQEKPPESQEKAVEVASVAGMKSEEKKPTKESSEEKQAEVKPVEEKASTDKKPAATAKSEEKAKEETKTDDSSSLTKRDPSVSAETNEPPAIISTSSDRASALANQLEKAKARMYGAVSSKHFHWK